ncbi:hypothetical protein PR048_010007 [Dryococelus australis]|uniref:Transcription initiation factor TFIID subunit 2 TPR repeats domain-containing protein n=1 Tax=Dryococelus australis TaxID=614101 RepID=A0ABQ9I3D8_9NEOP|nr:hypothetical protein PR048_010007 [Dryococelus australis]
MELGKQMELGMQMELDKWRVDELTCMLSYDSRLRCDIVDLYYTLYGTRRPVCLPVPEVAAILNSLKPERRPIPICKEFKVPPLLSNFPLCSISSMLTVNCVKYDSCDRPCWQPKMLPPVVANTSATSSCVVDGEQPSTSGLAQKRKASSPVRETELITDDNNLGLVTIEIVAGDEGSKVRVKVSTYQLCLPPLTY